MHRIDACCWKKKNVQNGWEKSTRKSEKSLVEYPLRTGDFVVTSPKFSCKDKNRQLDNFFKGEDDYETKPE